MNLILCAVLPLQLFLITPLAIYLTNVEEMTAGILDVVKLCLIPVLAVFLLLAIIIRSAPEKPRQLIKWLIASLTLLLWMQANLIVWDYGVLDGQNIEWQSYRWRGWIDIAAWFGVFTALYWIARNRVEMLVGFVTLLVLIQLGTLGFQVVKRDDVIAQEQEFASQEALDNLYRFSKEGNVLHLVIDGFQSDVLDLLVNHKDVGPIYRRSLEGFTFYREALGVFPFTRFSVPAFLGGKIYQNQTPKDEFIDGVLMGKNILNQATEQGYELDVGSGAIYWVKRYAVTRTSNIYGLDNDVTINLAQSQAAHLVDLAIFRSIPHFVKPAIYNEQNWWLSGAFEGGDGSKHWYFKHTSFLNAMISNLRVDRVKPVYKYMHIMNTHNPMVVDDKCQYLGKIVPMTRVTLTHQSNCTMHTLSLLFDRMREAGIYDNTLIVMHGDHGGWVPFLRGSSLVHYNDGTEVNRAFKALASPMLAIKPAKASDPFTISDKLVSLVQIPDTIRDIMDWPDSYGSQSIRETADNHTPTRIFRLYRWQRDAWETDYTGPIFEFEITGSHYESKWNHVGTIQPPK